MLYDMTNILQSKKMQLFNMQSYIEINKNPTHFIFLITFNIISQKCFTFIFSHTKLFMGLLKLINVQFVLPRDLPVN